MSTLSQTYPATSESSWSIEIVASNNPTIQILLRWQDSARVSHVVDVPVEDLERLIEFTRETVKRSN